VREHPHHTRESGADAEYIVQPAGGQTIIWVADGIVEWDVVIVDAS
jgi:hypothetical protein